jgi:hypothetical protein
MANTNNNYPQSSTNSYQCTKNNYVFSNGVPTNMSVRSCDFPSYYECYDKKIFKHQIEPRNIHGFVNLNPDAIREQYDKSFSKVMCENTKQVVYTSSDPRLISSTHGGQVLGLDKPPINGGQIKLADIYTDPTLQNYGKQYSSYMDVNAGDIVYYIDKSIQDAFYKPVYENNAYDTGVLYKDPMGAMKPQYERQPILGNNVLNTKRENYQYGLSWLSDSIEQREDLISKQQLKNNQQKYSARWTGNIFV